jgi:hypothetical protein
MTEKEKLIQERTDAEWVISTSQGRRFMWRLLSDCGIYKDYHGSQDEIFKQIGRRQIGLHLLGIISDASEDRLFEMMREAKTRSTEEKIQYERANRDVVNNYIDELPGYTADGPEF